MWASVRTASFTARLSQRTCSPPAGRHWWSATTLKFGLETSTLTDAGSVCRWSGYSSTSEQLVPAAGSLRKVTETPWTQGLRSWSCGVLTPRKCVGGVRAVVKVVLWSRGGSPDEARLEQTSYPFQPTNLALYSHKITLYRFNRGGSYYCRGAQMGAGAEPSLPPSLWPLGQSTFWPHKNVTFFHSKLLLYNFASFTSSGMKDLCQKWKVNRKNWVFELPTGCQEPGLLSVWKSLTSVVIWNSLMAWPDWPWPPEFTTGH